MAPGMKRFRKLDPKLCFELWIEVGSVYKVSKVMASRGMINMDTGKPFSHMGVWEAANRYLLDNMPEARKRTESVWRANGELLTDADWYRIVLEKARHLSPKKYAAFIEKHKYLAPYL